MSKKKTRKTVRQITKKEEQKEERIEIEKITREKSEISRPVKLMSKHLLRA